MTADTDDNLAGIEIGTAYLFWWMGEQITGVAVSVSGTAQWVTFRTSRSALKVPPQHVIKRAD